MATCFPPTSTVVLVTAALWVAALLAPVTAIAQSTTATILGTVTDSSDAVMPGVAVTIVNEGTNSQRTVTTDGTGGYAAPLLPPGAYHVGRRGPVDPECLHVVTQPRQRFGAVWIARQQRRPAEQLRCRRGVGS
jgi:hypothetical protein